MNKAFPICLFFSLFLGLLAYLVSSSLIYLGWVSVLAFLIFFFLMKPMVESCFLKRKKGHECFKFINSFVISLSVTSSLEKAYEVASEGFVGTLSDVIKENQTIGIIPRIKSLSNYFEKDSYLMFLSVLDIYIEQGGDMLDLSSELLSETARIEETSLLVEKDTSRHLFNFIVLNMMSLAIICFMRFGLKSFYSYLNGSPLYLGALAIYFVFILFSFLLYCTFYTGEKIPLPFLSKGKPNGSNKKTNQ